ncbi:hypothetical protein B7486_16360 [cyanobacterium TDX16]|nr:hypothetical protein B7486_16360 [cyanobacterium TDX16]
MITILKLIVPEVGSSVKSIGFRSTLQIVFNPSKGLFPILNWAIVLAYLAAVDASLFGFGPLAPLITRLRATGIISHAVVMGLLLTLGYLCVLILFLCTFLILNKRSIQARLWSHARAEGMPICDACGYPLAVTESIRCPECGITTSPAVRCSENQSQPISSGTYEETFDSFQRVQTLKVGALCLGCLFGVILTLPLAFWKSTSPLSTAMLTSCGSLFIYSLVEFNIEYRSNKPKKRAGI